MTVGIILSLLKKSNREFNQNDYNYSIMLWGEGSNGYGITVFRRGSPQMITIDYIGGGGSQKNPKSDYVILEQPLT